MPDNLSSRVTKELRIEEVVEYKTEYDVSDIVQPANITVEREESEAVLPGKIMQAFNRGVESSLFTNVSVFRPGTRINPRQFWLGSKNQVPELALDNGERKGRKLSAIFSPYIQSQLHGSFDFFARYYGANGSYVVNVPPGMYARAKASGNAPLILGEGTHVIHDKGLCCINT